MLFDNFVINFIKKPIIHMFFNTLIALLMGVLSIPQSCLADTIQRSVRKEVEKQALNKIFVISPQLNRLTSGFSEKGSNKYYFIKSVDKIFFQHKYLNVKVTEIKFEDDGPIFELSNDSLGKGKIRFVFNQKDLEALDYGNIIKALEAALSPSNSDKVRVSSTTNIFHIATCNHLPSEEDTIQMSYDEAVSKGFKPCGYCFAKMIYMPDYKIETQLAHKAASSIRYNHPLTIDESLQKRVQEIGNRVLQRWPLPLLGYNYNFQVIDNKYPNAVSLPGGNIMINTSLLNSAENDEELEAVLAHEIAHVERRHVLRNYYHELEIQKAQAVLAGMGAIFAGVAAANSHQSVSFATLGATLVGLIALDVYNSGYPKEFENEADDLATFYFTCNGLNLKNLLNVFKKFEFLNLNLVGNPDPESYTHPYLEDRISRIMNFKYDRLINQNFICKQFSQPTIQVDFLYHRNDNNEQSILLYFNDYAAIERWINDPEMSIGLSLKENKAEISYILDKRSVVRDTWGVYLTFTSNSKIKINNIENISISGGSNKPAILTNYSSGSLGGVLTFKRGVVMF